MDSDPIIIEQSYPTTAENIWEAMTSRKAMKQWYFELQEFIPEVGFEFQFTGGPAEDRQYLHFCKITEVIAGRKLAYSWRYDGYEGNTLVTFELFPEGKQTMLKLTHEGLETFPASNPDFGRENFVVGWNWILGTSLKEYLEKIS